MTAPFTAREQSVVDRFDSAPDAPESLRMRVASRIFFADMPWMPAEDFDAGFTDPAVSARCHALADAAIAVITGGQS